MKDIGKIAGLFLVLTAPGFATNFPPCMTQALSSYVGGGFQQCSESPDVTIAFNQSLLPSYQGLNLLTGHDAADPDQITATPGTPGFNFTSNTFRENTALLDPLAAQDELVQFAASTTGTFVSTTFSLQNAQVTGPGLTGAGVVVGQELVCVGGNFTSLPTGLITSVTNGLLGTGQFGCNGVVLVGTVGDEIGALSAVTSLVNLPNLTGLSDSATIQLAPYNASTIDVIKIQALLGVAGGSAQTTGFGDTFSTQAAGTPEPSTWASILLGVALIGLARVRRHANASAEVRQ